MKREHIEQLAKGKLCFASNMAAQKLHIVRLDYSAYEVDMRKIDTLKKKEREAALVEYVKKYKVDQRKALWSATALCGVEGGRVTYGNRTDYYWTCMDDLTLDRACMGCQRVWRKLGEPEIVGHVPGGDPHASWPYELPFGWREVPMVPKHPWDVPRGGDIESIKSNSGKTQGRFLEEIKRWRRGPIIVRLAYHPDTGTYSARHWDIHYDPNGEHCEVRGTLETAREYCHRLMACGG